MVWDIFRCFWIWKKFKKQKKLSKNVVFLLFRPIKWPISREPLIRFSISFFLNAQNLILNRPYVFRFSISLIVFSQNAKNWFSDLATMKSAILQILTWWRKTNYGFGFSDPKLGKIDRFRLMYIKKVKFCRPV